MFGVERVYYLNHYRNAGAETNDPKGAKIIRKEKRRWQAADTNKDDRLSYEEYKAVLHPDQFDHTKVVHVQETLEDMDKDGDGYLSKTEFIGKSGP